MLSGAGHVICRLKNTLKPKHLKDLLLHKMDYFLILKGISKIPYVPDAGVRDVLCFKYYKASEVSELH